jgi:hypothetical protein
MDKTRAYLMWLNDPDGFARRMGVTDSTVRQYLHAAARAARARIRTMAEIVRRARKFARLRFRDPDSILPPAREAEVHELARTPREQAELRRMYVETQRLLRVMEATTSALAASASGTTLGDLRRIARRADKVLKRIRPSASVRSRVSLCPLCDKAFLRPRRAPAQKFCPACRRRYTRQQRWWRVTGKTRYQAEKKKGGEKAQTRT